MSGALSLDIEVDDEEGLDEEDPPLLRQSEQRRFGLSGMSVYSSYEGKVVGLEIGVVW